MAGDGETVDADSGLVREPVVSAPEVPQVTIGRIVQYVTLDGNLVPAIICRSRFEGGIVDLQVFHYDRGIELARGVVQGDGTAPETWCWPRR